MPTGIRLEAKPVLHTKPVWQKKFFFELVKAEWKKDDMDHQKNDWKNPDLISHFEKQIREE